MTLDIISHVEDGKERCVCTYFIMLVTKICSINLDVKVYNLKQDIFIILEDW